MATSGSTRVNVSPDGKIYLLYNWWTISQDINTNASKIGWSLQLISAKQGYNIVSTQPKNCKVNINNKVIADIDVNVSIDGGKSKTLTTGDEVIPHDADGTKVFNYGFSQVFNINYNGSQITTKSGSGSGSLNTIPRATTPTTVSSANFGTEITINTPRASDVFTHKLIYYLADSKGVIAEDVATSTKWTIPLNLMNEIPNATSTIIAIRCETYNGSIYVGAKTISLTANVPNDIVPSIDDVTFTDAVSGIANKFNDFVKDKSKFNVSIKASGIYSSTIVNYSSDLLGVTYKGATFTSGLITSAGTVSLSITVTDSRGRKANVIRGVRVQDYYTPKIELFSVNRCNSNGELKDDGNHLKIDLTLDIASVNENNDKSYRVEYRESDSSTYSLIDSGNNYRVNKTIISNSVVNVDNAYRVRLIVSDYFNSNIVYEVDIPTSFSLIDFNESGKGLAFGESSNANNFSVNMDAHFKKAVKIDDTSQIDGLKETEWQYLQLDSKFKPYTDNQINTPRYRRRGKIVDIRGVFSPIATMSSSYTQVPFASGLPEEFRPSETIYQLCVGSTKETWTLSIKNDGTLNISQYGINSYSDIQANARLIFQITYTLD